MNRGNRILWLALGLILVALGAVGIWANTGGLPGAGRDSPILTGAMIDRWHSAGLAAPAVTAAVALVVAGLGVWLLSRQLRVRSRAPREMLLLGANGGDDDRPTTSRVWVRTTALTDALSRDITRDHFVRRADVLLDGAPRHPVLRIGMAVSADADLPALGDRVNRSLTRWQETTGLSAQLSDVVVREAARAPLPAMPPSPVPR